MEYFEIFFKNKIKKTIQGYFLLIVSTECFGLKIFITLKDIFYRVPSRVCDFHSYVVRSEIRLSLFEVLRKVMPYQLSMYLEGIV